MFGFDEAIRQLKQGNKIKRAHWGGYWFIPDYAEGSDPSRLYDVGSECNFKFNTMIVACLKDDAGYVPATAYQEDLLAEDWSITE